MNLFRLAKGTGENRIFRDENALLPDFLPEELPGREREVRELVYCLSPASENRQPSHALLVGPPGVGKTSAAKLVLKHLSEYSKRPLPVYVNCWESQSRFAVLSELSVALEEPMPRRGIAADEVFARVVEIGKKEGRIPIMVLDEVDRLSGQDGGVQVLYDLCRAGEAHSFKVGVVAITNDAEFPLRLDPRIRSSFVQHILSFGAYTVPQLKDILSARAGAAFIDGALDADVVPLCAAIAFKQGGDARVALSLLHSAGKAAERQNSSRVLVEHVRAMQDKALAESSVKAERKLSEMDEIDQKIVLLAKEAGKEGIESGSLYLKMSKLAGERAVRARVDRLIGNGILFAEARRLPMGRSRVLRIKE
ncbi:MAG: AAA family ATPase [Candidatus Micrarchaeia archaeon]